MNEEKIKANIAENLLEITKEFTDGFELIKKYPRTVVIFGSARLTDKSSHYTDVMRLSKKIVEETKYTIITGGGSGIMEAASAGAKEGGGVSVGFNITLPHEQVPNPYLTEFMTFKFFFARKALMAFSSEAYIFFPGGYGTLDELFGVLTLIQTKKIPQVPVILFGKDYWKPFVKCIEDHVLNEHHAITEEDFKLFVMTDSISKTIEIIKGAPVSEWWDNLD